MTPGSKGDLGEVSVIKELKRQGFTVFSEVGNGSRVDLIAMNSSGQLFKIQVKCTTSKNGTAILNLRKNTLDPKYNYHYKVDDVDAFALYVEDLDIVAFIPSEIAFSGKDRRSGMKLRIAPAKNNQVAGVKVISDFLTFLGR